MKQKLPGSTLRVSSVGLGGAKESALLPGSQMMQIRVGGLRSPQKTADINSKTQSLHDHTWKGSARILTEWRPPLGRLLLGSVGAWRRGCPQFRVTGGLGWQGPESSSRPPPHFQVNRQRGRWQELLHWNPGALWAPL